MKFIPKITSRPIRSFRPETIKPYKMLHFRGDGAKDIGFDEPTWPAIDEQQNWTRDQYDSKLWAAFSWYALTQDDKTVIALGLDALGKSGHFPELITTINNSSLPFSITAAKLLRMAQNGLFLRFKERRFIAKQIKLSLNNQKPVIESASKTDKPTVQDYVAIKMHKIKAEIDGMFDDFVESGYTYGGLKIKETNLKKPLSVVTEMLNTPEFSLPLGKANELIDYCQKYLAEYKAAYAEKMPFAEAYPLSKRKLKDTIEWWEQAITDITVFDRQKKATRKPRAKKQKSPLQQVAKIKYLLEDKTLKLKSVEPTQILKASELWVYNVKLRKLGYYVSLNKEPFEISGTKLSNLDTVKSNQKALRRPKEQLKEFESYSKTGVVRWFNQIRAVSTSVRPALNKDCIILKAVK